MTITDVECRIFLVEKVHTEIASSAQDSIAVLIHADEGITSFGKTDAKFA